MESLKTFLKVLARSRSLTFTRNYSSQQDNREAQYKWKGHEIFYRIGTSDAREIYKILLKSGRKSEYAFPKEFGALERPVTVILDIGANIGISTLYLAALFPNARLFAFEPDPDNFQLLIKNTQALERVTCMPYALGQLNSEVKLYDSVNPNNYSGFSLYEEGRDIANWKKVQCRHAGAVMKELGLFMVDFIKIDTEGAEWEILTSIGDEFISSTKLIMGELHGRRDFALLDYLQPWFHIGLRKNITNRLFIFYALNRLVA